MNYRPWGSVDWAISLGAHKSWDFVGAIGSTERSLCGWATLKKMGVIQNERFAQIDDVYSEKYFQMTQTAMNLRLQTFIKQGGRLDLISRFDLMAELFQIISFSKSCTTASESVIFDITALPKRFFFPILRTFINDKKIKNLLLIYTSPAEYTNEPLYEDIETWKALPGFSGSSNRSEHWIVSVGFLVESLRQYLGDNPDHERMKLLISFPAPLGILRRTWESVARLEGGQLESREGKPRFEKFRGRHARHINSVRPNRIFGELCTETDRIRAIWTKTGFSRNVPLRDSER